MTRPSRTAHADKSAGGKAPFTEAEAWDSIGGGWRPLFGNFRKLGFSFEWHDFEADQELDWSRSFHPGSIELCLNLAGRGSLADGQRRVALEARMLAFYHQGEPPLAATRQAGERHQFITVEFSPEFLREHLRGEAVNLHPLVRSVVGRESTLSQISAPDRLGTALAQLVESLRHPPVFARAQAVWFQGKALELAAHLFFHLPGGELFCTRQQRAARERVERVKVILQEKLNEPPSLDELGKLVGSSPFYLSRLFSQEVGMTIQQYLRQIRMERAAELLRTGKCNVTEAALEVGYSSLSHFSATFHQIFGCCPGLYPLKTPTQAQANEPD
jgi:AraC-like DNA-binding protein